MRKGSRCFDSDSFTPSKGRDFLWDEILNRGLWGRRGDRAVFPAISLGITKLDINPLDSAINQGYCWQHDDSVNIANILSTESIAPHQTDIPSHLKCLPARGYLLSWLGYTSGLNDRYIHILTTGDLIVTVPSVGLNSTERDTNIADGRV